jgi:enamine deaminase RidA (YjgF/YER057c/UK114 family)
MSNIKRIESGARMSEAVIHAGKIYTAGIVADKAVGKSVFEQTTEILQQIDALLAQASSNKTLILKANIWLTDISTFAQMNQAWDAWAVAGKTPARATVEAKLAAAGYDVEIMIEAAVAE